MHTRIAYTDPLLELLDCIEDAVQLLAFEYFSAARDELDHADRLLNGSLRDWQGEDALLARAWLAKARTPPSSDGEHRRAHYAGTLWRARRAVRRYWLRSLGIAWDPYHDRLTGPGTRIGLRVIDGAGA